MILYRGNSFFSIKKGILYRKDRSRSDRR